MSIWAKCVGVAVSWADGCYEQVFLAFGCIYSFESIRRQALKFASELLHRPLPFAAKCSLKLSKTLVSCVHNSIKMKIWIGTGYLEMSDMWRSIQVRNLPILPVLLQPSRFIQIDTILSLRRSMYYSWWRHSLLRMPWTSRHVGQVAQMELQQC